MPVSQLKSINLALKTVGDEYYGHQERFQGLGGLEDVVTAGTVSSDAASLCPALQKLHCDRNTAALSYQWDGLHHLTHYN
jgi:hypothetical protein